MSSDVASNVPNRLDNRALDVLFCKARTHTAWLPKEVSDQTLRDIYELYKWGPTSANMSPARVVFVKSQAAKARLVPALAAGNVDKTKSAPVTAIVAYDTEFFEHLPRLFPHADMKVHFVGNPSFAAEAAFRNGSLQGGYLIIAARALGLDCGPMSGFDQGKLNAEFFPDGKWKSNFLCNLGYGDSTKLFPRSPRLEFDEACRIV